MSSDSILPRSLSDDDWLTPREVGPILRVTEKTLSNWRSLGIGPPYRKLSDGRSGRVRYRKAVVLAWLDRCGKAAA
ncbi:helix-turn-helix transcriptional regulator [Streptomyces sp. NBC_00096]|uniref:helix-turn-helix transcriptional regulator n=1 Tax=Streptomyces sp. NBC_00096 TaxID=2975650 RepID=UPI003247CD11